MEYLTKKSSLNQTDFLDLVELRQNISEQENLLMKIYNNPLYGADLKYFIDFLEDKEKEIVKKVIAQNKQEQPYSLGKRYFAIGLN